MVERRNEMLMSEAKLREKSYARWLSVRLVLVASTVVIFSIPATALIIPVAIRRLQPAAEFLLLVVAPTVWEWWNWINPAFLYLLLNILLLILTLRVKYGALTASKSHGEFPLTNFIRLGADADSAPAPFETHIHSQNQSKSDPNTGTEIVRVHKINTINDSKGDQLKDLKAQSAVRGNSGLKELQPGLAPAFPPSRGLYCNKSKPSSSLRRSTAKLSNLSRECQESSRPIPDLKSGHESSRLVIFEITADVGEVQTDVSHEKKIARHEGSLSSEELYAKAESFIGNFYRELKMQREESWKRLYAIYGQSS